MKYNRFKIFGKVPEYFLCLWLVLTINFILPRVIQGDSFAYLESGNDIQVVLSPEWKKKLASYYGLDKPIFEQYMLYLKNTLSLNFGFSTYFKGPVSKLIADTLPWTVFLAVSSIFFSSFLGIIMGMLSAWKRGWVDKSLQVVILGLVAVPPFVLAVVFQIIFCVYLNFFPLYGAESAFLGDVSVFAQMLDIFSHSVLPVSVLTLSLVGGNYLLARASIYDIMGEEYIMFARTKGVLDIKIAFKHVLRNALLPVVTYISLRVAYAVTGTIFIESIFSYPGMGKLIFDAVSVHDYPVVQGTFFVFTLFVLCANIFADFLYPIIDPRLRFSGISR